MLESRYANELTELGFDEWSEEDGITREDIPVFMDTDLPCFFLVEIPDMPITFVVDELRKVWCADGLIDLSYLGFSEMEINGPEGAEEAGHTVH